MPIGLCEKSVRRRRRTRPAAYNTSEGTKAAFTDVAVSDGDDCLLNLYFSQDLLNDMNFPFDDSASMAPLSFEEFMSFHKDTEACVPESTAS